MNTSKKGTGWMVRVALMVALVILLANTPLGMIQLPIIKATTVHIPVIIGAILLGPLAGAILGGVFGICSMLSNTYAPTLLSFAFSPFMSTTGLVGAVKAIWVSIGCRILIGVVAGWAFILLKKIKCPRILSYGICGFLGAKYCRRHGQYLSAVCAAVCTGKRGRTDSRIRSCHGNRNCFRHPGSHLRYDSCRTDYQSACCGKTISKPITDSSGREGSYVTSTKKGSAGRYRQYCSL